jgi:glucuronoarabinoxylan endo-1,4-beta-xylanase
MIGGNMNMAVRWIIPVVRQALTTIESSGARGELLGRRVRMLTAACLLLIATASGWCVDIAVRPDVQFQTIRGWGASSNFYEEEFARLPDSVQTAIFDLVYADLGMNVLCIRLYSSFQPIESGPYNWSAMAAQRMILQAALDRGNINYVWVKVSSPPGWMKDNNDAAHGGHVLPQHYQDYADYLADYFVGMDSTYGFHLDGLSLFNEPGFGPDYESTSTTPQEYRDILRVVDSTFQSRGLGDVKFHAPESGHITGAQGGLSEYLPVIFADESAAASLDVAQTHQYGDYLMLYGTGAADDWAGLRELAGQHGKPVWESEIFIGGPLATQDIMEGLRISQLIWTALTQGNTEVWHYWQYAFPETPNNSSGIVSYNQRQGMFSVRPRYYVLKQWARNIPSGSVRVEAVSTDDSLKAAAFLTGNEGVSIITFNLKADSVPARFELPGLVGSVQCILTSATDGYAEQPAVVPDDSGFSIVMAPRSVCTLVTSVRTGVIRERIMEVSSAQLACYPNPVNSSLTIAYRIGNSGKISLRVFDLLGREVVVLLNTFVEAGSHTISLDRRGMASGIYFVRLDTKAFSRTTKFALVK